MWYLVCGARGEIFERKLKRMHDFHMRALRTLNLKLAWHAYFRSHLLTSLISDSVLTKFTEVVDFHST